MVVSGNKGGGGGEVHRFNLLPCFKWGNQKQLRCVGVSDSTAVKDNNGASADRIKRSRSPATEIVAAPDDELRNFKKFKPTVDSNGVEEGIETVREKLTILRKGVESHEKPTQRHHQKREDTEVQAKKTWNLRKRKPPVGGNSISGKGLRIEERGVSNSSAEVRPKFSLALSKNEIEDDFMTMLGHKAPRRVKKRPRKVQKQMDMIFPGSGLAGLLLIDIKCRRRRARARARGRSLGQVQIFVH
ncbi:uncharacterized protein [Euphorbia lathyris]|uniref:uncharacterized protein n=1 Tax=Euphorbia lathyris TaxID=212925 RepID=UPI003313358D